MVVCTLFMGGWCACALAHVYPENNLYFVRPGAVEFGKLGQTPLIYETEPFEI